MPSPLPLSALCNYLIVPHTVIVPVECSKSSFQLDMDSLRFWNKILIVIDTNLDTREQQETTGAKHLLLCYMRGKLPDVEAVIQFCKVWNRQLFSLGQLQSLVQILALELNTKIHFNTHPPTTNFLESSRHSRESRFGI